MQGNSELFDGADAGNLTTNLSLKPPAITQQTIEYNTVFKLQLSQHFYNLYKACYQKANPPAKVNAAIMEGGQYAANNLRLIDLRPNRWYFELDRLSTRLQELKSELDDLDIDKQTLSAALKELRKDRFGDKKDQFDTTEKAYYATFTDIEFLKSTRAKTQSALRDLIHEISAAGYNVIESKPNEFDIFQPIEYDGKPPIQDKIDDTTLTDDKLWDDLVVRLQAILFDEAKPLVTAANKIAAFKDGVLQVKSKEGNSSIANKKANYQKKLDDLAILIDDLSKPAESKEDFNKMLQQLISDSQPKINSLTKQLADLTTIQKGIEDWIIDAIKHTRMYRTAVAMAVSAGEAQDHAEQSVLNAILPKSGPYYRDQRAQQLGFRNYQDLSDRIASTGSELTQYQAQKATNIDKATKDYLDKMDQELQSKIAEKSALELEFNNYDATALQLERAKFFSWWNNPDHYDINSNNVDDKNSGVKIEPGNDPLAKFYNKINSARLERNSPYQIHRFNYRAGEYYNESDLSLAEFMELPDLANKVAIFPHIDDQNNISTELFVAVISPRKPSAICEVQFPTFKLVETHQLLIGWEGFALSALSESVNLFPKEKKQIVIERQTKLTRTVNQSRNQKTDETRHITSSFENNLTSELSTTDNLSYSEERTQKTSRSNSENNKNSSDNKSEDSQDNSASVSAKGKLFGFGVDANAKTSSTSKRSKSQSQSKETALAVSESNDGQVLNKAARDTAAKNTQNTVSKVATETSNNNQVEITSSSSEQLEENASNKESIQLENPNSGRTINYNFFQVQNIYKGKTVLKDVKIVINTGLELVEGTGIVAKHVLELEEFNKLYKYTDKSDMAKILCAFIARRILKNYTGLAEDDTANQGILRLKVGRWEDSSAQIAELANIYKMLDLTLQFDSASMQGLIKFSAMRLKNLEQPSTSQPSLKDSGAQTALEKKLTVLTAALARLQKLSFEFNGQAAMNEQTYVVNAPAYHVDSQLGQLPATEPYLEDRRTLKLDMTRAEIDNLKSGAQQKKAEAEEKAMLKSLTVQKYAAVMTKKPDELDSSQINLNQSQTFK